MRLVWMLSLFLSMSAFGEEALPPSRIPGGRVVVSANYLIDSDCAAPTVERLSRMLEGYHGFLSRAFAERAAPAVGRMQVRCFAAQADYLAYGAARCPGFSRGWAGYYHHLAEDGPELVLYDLGANLAVARHEAFHQFMHRAFAGVAAWPPWFSEGLADYAARGRLVGDEYALSARVDATDLATVRAAIEAGRQLPLERLFALDRAAWDGPGQGLHYAQSYVLVHWLMNSAEAPGAGVLTAFLTRLVETQDHDAAFAATIGAAGIERLERAWLAWVRGGG